MTEQPSNTASLSCSPLPSSLRGLVEKWRYQADLYDSTARMQDTEEIKCAMLRAVAKEMRVLATELEALLAGAVPAPPQEEMETALLGAATLAQEVLRSTQNVGHYLRQMATNVLNAANKAQAALPVPPAVPQGWQPLTPKEEEQRIRQERIVSRRCQYCGHAKHHSTTGACDFTYKAPSADERDRPTSHERRT